ncbi:MAG: type II toxin-antitoxin system RatA family toxin [Magnetococcales bacterium]|nr:type II toxin-antitoxin system RatA family toxin [Magnetococcales bacterium]MBF0150334.1 type II toxin-antitoxin system RatA family toxin [Magnetococcales bacterium]MBF0173578.1 type II toxin-antitoxin system RatA family toxin [Magnetococcales bacterium]MBF0347440.1 type II toxin-antitoxin system RatA family toxin [Magnetococcales bacterium]MBF0629451.1 type II toxin-antitoxin system RatA family toxin [Magnetococcales bacterium]
MPRRSVSVQVPFSAQQMFDLVVDMDRYPEFIPWLVKSKKFELTEKDFKSEMTFAFKGLRETFFTRDEIDPPHRVSITHLSGPFSHLDSEWRFTDLPSGGSKVEFFIDFKFSKKLVDLAMGPVFGKASYSMVESFRKRAEQIYGS